MVVFVFDAKTINLIDDGQTFWESGPLNKLAKSRQSEAFNHLGFWHAMDTVRDKNHLE